MATVAGVQVDAEHLPGAEFLQRRARRQPLRQIPQRAPNVTCRQQARKALAHGEILLGMQDAALRKAKELTSSAVH